MVGAVDEAGGAVFGGKVVAGLLTLVTLVAAVVRGTATVVEDAAGLAVLVVLAAVVDVPPGPGAWEAAGWASAKPVMISVAATSPSRRTRSVCREPTGWSGRGAQARTGPRAGPR